MTLGLYVGFGRPNVENDFHTRQQRRAAKSAADRLLGSAVADLVLFLFLRLVLGRVLPVERG